MLYNNMAGSFNAGHLQLYQVVRIPVRGVVTPMNEDFQGTALSNKVPQPCCSAWPRQKSAPLQLRDSLGSYDLINILM